MTARSRAALVLSGTLLLHTAFILPAMKAFPTAVSESTLLLLVVATLVFFAASHLAEASQALASGTIAVLFFLLSPAVTRQSLAFYFSSLPVNTLGALVFVVSWLFMRNWSTFMRSLILALVYGLGLWFNADALIWVPVAMIPWVLFNRRPLPAAGTLLTILIGGSLFFGVSWMIVCLFTGQPGAIWQPLFNLRTMLAANSLARGSIDTTHLPSFLLLVSLPWTLLSAWTAWEHFKEVLVQRRAGLSSFVALLVGIVMVVCLFSGPRPAVTNSDILMTLVALSAPLVACDLARREYLFSRSSRTATALGFGLTGATLALIGWMAPEWLTTRLLGQGIVLAAMLVAMAVSRAIQANRPLDIRGHWRAVLAGSSLGCFLVINGFLWMR